MQAWISGPRTCKKFLKEEKKVGQGVPVAKCKTKADWKTWVHFMGQKSCEMEKYTPLDSV
jgi:hypothetical protein